MKQTIITAMLALIAHCAFAVAPDSLKKDLEDYDYLVSFVERNYAPFGAIMQKGYKGEYKSMKKQIRAQLCKGESDLEKAATDYVMWFYSQFDRHIAVETTAFGMAQGNIIDEAFLKMDRPTTEKQSAIRSLFIDARYKEFCLLELGRKQRRGASRSPSLFV